MTWRYAQLREHRKLPADGDGASWVPSMTGGETEGSGGTEGLVSRSLFPVRQWLPLPVGYPVIR